MYRSVRERGSYGFGRFQMDAARRTLTRDGAAVVLTATVFDTLLYLVENPARVVTKEELMAAIWPGRFVEESNITQTIFMLRKALRDVGDEGHLIVTAPGRGYRFTAEVRPMTATASPDATPVTTEPLETITKVGYRRVTADPTNAQPIILPSPLALPSKPSIAVLPFANLSGDPGQEYFVDGMVVEITNALSRFRSIFVIASGSSLSLKGNAIKPVEIARQLGVRYIVEGSVRKIGDRVRIDVELLDASNHLQIWAAQFEDTLKDVFVLQDSVALSVAGRVLPTVRDAEIRRAKSRSTEHMNAYDLYLRAMSLISPSRKTDILEARNLLDRALDLDPDFCPALSQAASIRRTMDAFGWSDDLEDIRRQGLDLAHRSVKVGSDDADALSRAATILAFIGGDREAAFALLDRADAINPGSTIVRYNCGWVRLWAGETGLAIGDLEAALRLSPIGWQRPFIIGFIGYARFQQRRFGEAAELLSEAAQQWGSPAYCAWLAATYGHLGQIAQASRALLQYRERSAQPVETFVRKYLHDPAHIRLFLDGIALAEGGGDTP